MPSLSVELTDEEDALLERLVASGRYASADEAIERGVRLLEQDEAEIAAFVEQINRVLGRMQRGEFESGLDDAATRRAFRAARRAWAAELAHSRYLTETTN